MTDVPPGTEPAALKASFGEFDALEAELVVGASGGGMGFVSFPSKEQLDAALKQGAAIGDTRLTLSTVKPRADSDTPGGRGTPGGGRNTPGGGRNTPGGRNSGRHTPGSERGTPHNQQRGRGDAGDWRRPDPADSNAPMLARARSEGAPASGRWERPPPETEAGWEQVTKSKKGSKTPGGRGNRDGRGPKGGSRSAPNTPRGGKGGKGGRKGQKEERMSRQDSWAAQQEETPEVDDDEEDEPEPVFDPNTEAWQTTLQGFWHTSGELEQVVGMGHHRHWTGKVNFTADGKFWMIKTDQGAKQKKKTLVYWSADSGTSGRWERAGLKLILYWFKWPAEKLKTRDGGQTFHSTQGYKFSIAYEETRKEWYPPDMPKDFVQASATPRARKKFIMPTRAERTFNLLTKYKDMGEHLQAEYPEGTEPTEIVTFLISSLFDMYQIMSLELTFRITKGGARGKAMCSELLEFDKATLKKLKKFNLGKFLERNDEKRISALQSLADRVWAVVKDPIYACPVPDVKAAEEELERLAQSNPDTAVEAASDQAPEPEPESGPAPPVDRQTLDRKLNGTWNEFVMLKDVTEAVECTKEFAHPEHNDLVCKLFM